MPQAIIEINGTAASDEDLPIDTLVQLSNDDAGDETTYLWEVVSQPVGAADALSSTVIENPTITAKKEGTYLLQLTVDASLSTEAIDRKLFRIRNLRSDEVLPAAQEDTEVSAEGWKPTLNSIVKKLDDEFHTRTIITGFAGGAMAQGDVVMFDGNSTAGAGLPGEFQSVAFNDALATADNIRDRPLGIVIGRPDGNPAVGFADPVIVQMLGLFQETTFVGSPTIGDPVFVSDTGQVSLTAGTNSRIIGFAGGPGGGTFRLFVNGINTTERRVAGEETVASGACDPTISHTVLTIDGTIGFTLADGKVIGFRKSFRVSIAINTPIGTMTPANFADGTQIDTLTLGDEFTFIWNGTAWRLVSLIGTTFS